MNLINPKKIIFWGTPMLTVEILESLKGAGYLPIAIVTNPDRPVGRHGTITPSPAKVWGEQNTIPILQPEKITPEFIEEIKHLDPDLHIVVAYGKILPQEIIDLPKYGTINIHYSLLPKYRGATPVESAILAGDTETGVCIQKMVYELDAGDILAEEKINIEPNEKAIELRARLNTIASTLLTKILPAYFENNITPQKQIGTASFCKKIKKEDGLITETEIHSAETDETTARNLWNKFRAYTPWPSLYFFRSSARSFLAEESANTDKTIRIKITSATFKNGKFIIQKIIPEGKKEMDYKNIF